MNILRWLSGVLRLQITCADPTGFLTEIYALNIPVEQVHVSDALTVNMQIKRRNYKSICQLSEKRAAAIKILEKYGLYWDMIELVKRPFLIGGIVFLLLLTLFLPTRVLFFRVEGNVSVPTRQILSMAAENGLEYGAYRRQVRSEKVKNALLKAIPQLEWVGINTAGCVATISVRERQSQQQPETHAGVSNIVAIRDGLVQEITVTAGSPVVKPGQQVTAGQILISGYTDCGLSVRAERAKGEVFAQTYCHLTALFPINSENRGEMCSEIKNYALIFGKNRINFFENGGNLGVGCVKMYEENYLTFPGGFILPIGIATYSYIYYTPDSADGSYEEALLREAERYLHSQMIAGTILSADTSVSFCDGVLRLEGEYICQEMIGKEQSEEIIAP